VGEELDYRLKKTLWAFHENRIAVTFEYEWHDEHGNGTDPMARAVEFDEAV